MTAKKEQGRGAASGSEARPTTDRCGTPACIEKGGQIPLGVPVSQEEFRRLKDEAGKPGKPTPAQQDSGLRK